jgi:hypothetical protein
VFGFPDFVFDDRLIPSPMTSQRCAAQELRRFLMAISTVHLEKVGTTFARLWEQRDLEVIGPLYHDDATFISPNPSNFSGTSRMSGV